MIGKRGDDLTMFLDYSELVKGFLEEAENQKLYSSYLKNPSDEKKERLDKKFKKHVYVVRCISYFIKLIHFESRNYDKKNRKISDIYLLTLDSEDYREDKMLVAEENDFYEHSNFEHNIEDVVSDPDIYRVISKLTIKQKDLLYYIYVKNLKDVEVALLLGISQQAVTKSKANILKKIRKGVAGNKK